MDTPNAAEKEVKLIERSETRKLLTRMMRNERLQKEKNKMIELNRLSREDKNQFFKEIKEHKADANTGLPDRLVTPVGTFVGEAVLQGFAAEAIRLATDDPEDKNFSKDYLAVSKYIKVILIENARAENKKLPPLTLENAKRLMKKLKRNKACDYMDFSFEHILMMNDRNLENMLETLNRFVSDIEQLGNAITNACQASMIIKGVNRLVEIVNNWRRISVLSGYTRLLDLYYGEIANEIVEEDDVREQLGYTRNIPYSHAKLLCNEAFAVARDQDRTCIAITIDQAACFPNVNRNIAIPELSKAGYTGDILLYTNAILSTRLA